MYEYTSRWHVIQETGVRDKRVREARDTSIERIASASVLVKKNNCQINHVHNEIVTSPPPL